MYKYIFALIALLFCFQAPLQAKSQVTGFQPYLLAQANQVSLEQAINKIKKKTNGRILSATTRKDTHIIKVLLPSGKVQIYKVKAR